MKQTDFFQDYRERKEHQIVGLMSGTSLDGVDAVLVSITTDEHQHVLNVTLLDQVSLPYTKEVKEKVSNLCIPKNAGIKDLTLAHFGLAYWNAAAVNALIDKGPYDKNLIDGISMHGQTVWHAPVAESFPGPLGPIDVTGTLQIGNAQLVSSLTGLTVISDFRSADMAEGGQGAPLAPYIDYLLFGNKEKGIAVQNIGGIGNVTVLPFGGDAESVFAFDTGPGNMIIDRIVSIGTNDSMQYDDGGAIASRGNVSQVLLSSLMEDPYFSMKPPKSTGREVYGDAFAQSFWKKGLALGLSFEDLVATSTAFTAHSIAQSYKDFVLPVTPLHTVIVSGGGARNKTLLSMLSELLPNEIEVMISDDFGVPDQAREAMAFALMGHESLMGRPGNIPSVTGARKSVVLGVVTMQHI